MYIKKFYLHLDFDTVPKVYRVKESSACPKHHVSRALDLVRNYYVYWCFFGEKYFFLDLRG